MSETKAPLLSPLMRWFLLAMILANIAGSMINMLMPIYLTELGASVGQVGLVFTLTSVVILALQILGGWISDSIGRLRAIAIGSIGGVLGFFLLLIAPSWQWMLLALSVNQIPYALVGPSFSAFIAENSTESNRGKVYGLTDTIYQVVGLIGPPLGGLLAGAYGFKPMIFVATLFYTAAAALRIWMARTMHSAGERDPQELTLSSFKKSVMMIAAMLVGGGVITWIFITDGVRDIAFRMSGELEPLYLQQVIGLSLQQIGLLGSFFAAAMMLTPLLSGKLADRYGERVPISGGFSGHVRGLHGFLASRRLPGFYFDLGAVRGRGGIAQPGVPIADLKSRAAAVAWRLLWTVLRQPGLFLPACSLVGSAALGALQSAPALPDHRDCLPAQRHPRLVQV